MPPPPGVGHTTTLAHCDAVGRRRPLHQFWTPITPIGGQYSTPNNTKGRLQDIWMAETRKDVESAFDFFLEAYGPKYDKAAACLAKDSDVLLTFYDFPAEHWKLVRTTNPIESTFATVRLRTYRTKGCLSRKTAMAMVFKLCQCAQRKWRKLDGSNHLAEIIRGVKIVDGERQDRAAA